MIDNDKSEVLLHLESVLDNSEDLIFRDLNEFDSAINVALHLNIIRRSLKALKDLVFIMDAEDEQHLKDLAKTGVFSLEDLAWQYQISVDKVREIIGLIKEENLQFCKEEEWKHSYQIIVPRELTDSNR